MLIDGRRTNGSSSVAIKTGSTYICDSMRDIITILTANLSERVRRKCQQVTVTSITTGNSDMTAKTGNSYTTGTTTKIASNSNGKSGISDHGESEISVPKWLWQRPTTGNENIDVSGPILQFLVVIRRRNRLATLLSSSSSSKIQNLSLEFWWCIS